MQPRKHYFAHIPTIAIFIAFAISGPLGLLLFLAKHLDRDAEKKEQARAVSSAEAPIGSTSPAADCRAASSGDDRSTREQKSARIWHKRLTLFCTILGALFLFSGGIDLVDVIGEWFYEPDFSELLTALTMTLGGGGALWMGLRMDRTHKLERQLDKIVGTRDHISLAELFAAAGLDETRGRTILESAIEHGYFGADAYVDNRTGTLVVRGAAPQPSVPPTPAPDPEPEDSYTTLLQQLRQVNDAIPDPVMTAKISRLEQISARIFALARQDPSKRAQLQKFMDYYLPTALKLLNTYAQLSAQDLQGEHISDAKSSIERSMDLLITAFENQLDKLFASDALDVSADIAALEGMLNLDGLTGSDFR